MASDDDFVGKVTKPGSDLTVKIPDSAKTDGIKVIKPVKLKRKSYDTPVKKRFDVRGDEEVADLHHKTEEAVQASKSEVTTTTSSTMKGTTRKSPHKLEKPPHKIKEQIMKLLGKDVQDKKGDKRKIMLPGQSTLESSETTRVSDPRIRNGRNDDMVEVIQLEHQVGSSSGKSNDVIEVIKLDDEFRNRIHGDETIKVNISNSGSIRSSVVVSKSSSHSKNEDSSTQPEEKEERLPDVRPRREPSKDENGRKVDEADDERQPRRKKSDSRESDEEMKKKSKVQADEKDERHSKHSSEDRGAKRVSEKEKVSRHKDEKGEGERIKEKGHKDEKGEGERIKEKDAKDSKDHRSSRNEDNRDHDREREREARKSPKRRQSRSRSRSRSPGGGRNRDNRDPDRRWSGPNPHYRPERGGRNFDNRYDPRFGRYGGGRGGRGGGRGGYWGGRGGQFNRFNDRRPNEWRNRPRSRTPERGRRTEAKERSRTPEKRLPKVKQEKEKKKKPSKEEIEKMEEELKKIDEMIEMRKSKKHKLQTKDPASVEVPSTSNENEEGEGESFNEAFDRIVEGGSDATTATTTAPTLEKSLKSDIRSDAEEEDIEQDKKTESGVEKPSMDFDDDLDVSEERIQANTSLEWSEEDENDYRSQNEQEDKEEEQDFPLQETDLSRAETPPYTKEDPVANHDPLPVGNKDPVVIPRREEKDEGDEENLPVIEKERKEKKSKRVVTYARNVSQLEYPKSPPSQPTSLKEVLSKVRRASSSPMSSLTSPPSETSPKYETATLTSKLKNSALYNKQTKGQIDEVTTSVGLTSPKAFVGVEGGSEEAIIRHVKVKVDDEQTLNVTSQDGVVKEGQGELEESDIEEGSVKSDRSSSGASSSAGGSDSDSDNSDSDSSDSEPTRKKKRSKKKKSKKKSRKTTSSNSEESESQSEVESDDSDNSLKKKKKKRKKKKKKKKKTKRIAKKHKKAGEKSIVMNETQFTAFLDKVKTSLRHEIVKEFKEAPPQVETTTAKGKTSKRDKKDRSRRNSVAPTEEPDEAKDAEVAHSDEMEFEMGTHHGFPTGVPLRKEDPQVPEIGEKGVPEQEEIFDVFKSDDELDNELDSENWKHSTRKDDREGKSNTTKEVKKEDRPSKSKSKDPSSRKEKKLSEEKDRDVRDEGKDRKRSSGDHGKSSDDTKKRGRGDDTKEEGNERVTGLSTMPHEKHDVDRERSTKGGVAGRSTTERMHHERPGPAPVTKDFPFTAADLPSPVDGIALATKVREEVYKSNDFWNSDGVKKQRPIVEKVSATATSSGETAPPKSRWDTTALPHIGTRLAKIADPKYPEEDHGPVKKPRKSVDDEKPSNGDKRMPKEKHSDKLSPSERGGRTTKSPEGKTNEKTVYSRGDGDSSSGDKPDPKGTVGAGKKRQSRFDQRPTSSSGEKESVTRPADDVSLNVSDRNRTERPLLPRTTTATTTTTAAERREERADKNFSNNAARNNDNFHDERTNSGRRDTSTGRRDPTDGRRESNEGRRDMAASEVKDRREEERRGREENNRGNRHDVARKYDDNSRSKSEHGENEKNNRYPSSKNGSGEKYDGGHRGDPKRSTGKKTGERNSSDSLTDSSDSEPRDKRPYEKKVGGNSVGDYGRSSDRHYRGPKK